MKKATSPLALLLMLCSVAHAQQEFRLDRLVVCASAPVTISLPMDEPPEQPMYRDASGEWQALEVSAEEGVITFTLPTDTGGRTLILLDKPEWLDLSDVEPPTIETLKVDDANLDPSGTVDLGRGDIQPREIELMVRDARNPVAEDSISVLLDGRPLEATGSSSEVIRLERDAKSVLIRVKLAELSQDAHRLTLAIADAAAEPHWAKMTLAFSTAPLLRNGGFEEITDEGIPVGWSCSAWSLKPDTECKFGAGDKARSGERSLMISGIGGSSLNLVCGQAVPLTPGKTYRLTGYYLQDEGSGHCSLIAGDKAQYDNSQKLTPVEDWTEFSWDFTAQNYDKFTLYLRRSGKGTIYYDDIKLEEIE